MKNLFYLIIPSLLFTSCASEGEEKTAENNLQEQTTEVAPEASTESTSSSAITGKWMLKDMDAGMEIPEDRKEMVEAMIQDIIANTWVELMDNGTLNSQTKMQGQIMNETGTWRQEGNKLITTNSKQVTEELTIVSSSANELVLSTDQQGTVITMTYSKGNS